MPTPALSTAFAVRGQAFNLSGVLRSQTTSNPITTGLAGLSAWVSKDDGTFVATTNAPVERNASGWVSLDLTAAEMTASKVDVMFTATGAVTDCRMIATCDLSAGAGRYDSGTTWRLDRLLLDLHDFLYNVQEDDGAAQRVYDRLGSLKASAVIVEGSTPGTVSLRSKLQ